MPDTNSSLNQKTEISVSDSAKNHLARELGNQKRFLYEYGYSQTVDILDQAGFLKEPKDV
jgi:hypothetical protein